jgi:hypothetical protein
MQLAVVFAALIHDVQHEGISNRQLALEDDPLSLLYNDTSSLEQQSLTIGFTELMQPEFAKLRKVAFPTRQEYADFRKIVVNLVLATDISKPEKMQITKDKWKTAFGDAIAAEQNEEKARRESYFTEITLPRQNPVNKPSSRRSIGSIFSDITVDVNAYNAAGVDEDEDEVSLSDTPESSESGGRGDFNQSGRSGYSARSDDGAESASSDGIGGCLNTPDSAPGTCLQKIEESDKNGNFEIDSRDLGYSSTNKSSLNGSGHTPTNANTSRAARNTRGNRRMSTTSVPEATGGLPVVRGNALRRRRASIATGENQVKRLQRRFSSGSAYSTGDMGTRKFRQRLGIMRSVDLSGETIENYSRKGSMRTASVAGNSRQAQGNFPFEEYDEPDEMRATVVMETLLLSADVAHNLQVSLAVPIFVGALDI